MVAEYDGNPYQRLVDMARLAIEQGGIIKGILLHQGGDQHRRQEWPSKVKRSMIRS